MIALFIIAPNWKDTPPNGKGKGFLANLLCRNCVILMFLDFFEYRIRKTTIKWKDISLDEYKFA